MSRRSEALAERVEQGARALAGFAADLSAGEWAARVRRDGRRIGVVIHHVAAMYPLAIELAQTVASGRPLTGLTWDVIHVINARHARQFDGVTKAAALDLLERHSAAAAAAIGLLDDERLDRAAPVSLYGDATLTCQFLLEDHAVRHSRHHLSILQAALSRRASSALAG